MINKNSSTAICFFLALLLLFPKLLLLDYTNNALWGDFNSLQRTYIFVQDLMLSMLYFFLLIWACKKNRQLRLVCGLGVLILFFLMLDIRVRELWLHPIDLDLIKYTFNNHRDLTSGSEVFLKYYAGLNMTFRRALFILIFIFLSLFSILFWIQKNGLKANNIQLGTTHRQQLLMFGGVLFLILFAFSVKGNSIMYSTQENTLIAPIVKLFTSNANKAGSFATFEQPLYKLNSSLAPNNDHPSDGRFKNVIIIILESVRYKEFIGMYQEGSSFHMPFIKTLAADGLMQKCYVSVPHTSKSQFAILSGRNPFADIEMRESMIGNVPSIVSLLKETRGSSSHFITVQNLSFENTSGMIKALGFESLYGPDDFQKNSQVSKSSSFGLSDATLANYPFERTVKQDKPFILTFMTMGAHYPYDYPDKSSQAGTGHKEYLKAEQFADQSLSQLFNQLDKNSLLEETLVVLVGDHGESFGEHGLYIHNSSMYEEEVTVPLIFWAKDKTKLKGLQMRQPARQIDIAPTIADLLGITQNKNYILQGVSLVKQPNQQDVDYPVFISTFFSNISQAIVYKNQKIILNNKSNQITKFSLDDDLDEKKGTGLVGKEYDQYKLRFENYSNYHQHIFNKSR